MPPSGDHVFRELCTHVCTCVWAYTLGTGVSTPCFLEGGHGGGFVQRKAWRLGGGRDSKCDRRTGSAGSPRAAFVKRSPEPLS